MRHQVGGVGPSVLHAGAGLAGVPLVRPARLGDDDLHGGEALPVHRRADGVHLGVEHVGVGLLRAVVETTRVRLEEAEGERLRTGVALVGEERIGVDHEGPPRLLEEAEDPPQGVLVGRIEGPRRGRRRLRQHRHGVHRGDLDLAGEGLGGQGRAEVLHGREQLRGQRGVSVEQDLVADRDGGDGGGRIVGEDVGGHPRGGGAGVAGEGRDVPVRGGDHKGDVGSGQRLDDGGVGAVQSELGDGR